MMNEAGVTASKFCVIIRKEGPRKTVEEAIKDSQIWAGIRSKYFRIQSRRVITVLIPQFYYI
jgi:hypothetical protein